MLTYSQKLINTFHNFNYLMYQARMTGFFATAQKANITNFDSIIQSTISHGLELISDGMEYENMKSLLELKRIEFIKDASLTSEDLKLIYICMEYFFYLSNCDYEEYLMFVEKILKQEGTEEDITLINKSLDILLFNEQRNTIISNEEFNKYFQNINTKDTGNVLSKEEIDKLMNNDRI
ncbi:hypothetical protein CEQ21_04735 [Niallia circulans]|uniref:Uncharacterized protein n=2 Tax=Niallia circulans TaxID=1397 RepID=A0A553STE9_NIACI|nr:hypothetical protein CEQ21_04735 [Niallia circulans]